MENRGLTDAEADCILSALREVGVAEESVLQEAVRKFRMYRFSPELNQINGPRRLVAYIALRTRATGITLGSNVFIRSDELDDELRGSLQLIAHEAAHVTQFLRDGSAQFLTRYVGSYLRSLLTGSPERDAYLNIPYEREAREVARLALEHHAGNDEIHASNSISTSDRRT